MQPHSLVVRASVVLACLVGVVACGDDDTASTPGTSNSCTGTRLTDEQLCKLTCKTSTPSDTRAALGAPTQSTSSSGTQLDRYMYSCVEGNAVNYISLETFFSDGVLSSVSITTSGSYAGTALPACIASCGQ